MGNLALNLKRDFIRHLTRVAILLAFISTVLPASATENISEKAPSPSASEIPDRYKCGGPVESKIWTIWDDALAEHTKEEVNRRLKMQGDVYALYDLQVRLSNLQFMASRCGRYSRLRELAQILRPAFEEMNVEENPPFSRLWKCTGGRLCNTTNGLIGKEVMLVSIQFLGLTSALAKSLALEKGQIKESAGFIEISTRVAIEHIKRWTKSEHLNSISQRALYRPRHSDRSSANFLTDKDLWMSTVMSNLAVIIGVLQESFSAEAESLKGGAASYFVALDRLIAERVSIESQHMRNADSTQTVSVDSGFWTKFPDNRFAMHEGAPPVRCERRGDQVIPVLEEWASDIPLDPLATWDISHARRFVPFFAARSDSSLYIKKVINIEAKDWEPYRKAMAAQFIGHIWNQDEIRPLFTNYLNGRNGWYRVGYNRGDGTCTAGIKPFGLSNSFPTGGYIEWANQEPRLHKIGQTLHSIFTSSDKNERDFVRLYYPRFSQDQSVDIKMYEMLMFLPSLIIK